MIEPVSRSVFLTGGSSQLPGAADYWYGVRYSRESSSYQQFFVSEFLCPLMDLGIGRLFSESLQVVVASTDSRKGRIVILDLATLDTSSFAIDDDRPTALELVNLDQDALDEILVLTEHGFLRAYEATGELLWELGGIAGRDLAVGQLDHDPSLEVATAEGVIVDLESRAIQADLAIWGPIAVGDTDGDGVDELVAGGYTVDAYDVDTQSLKWSTVPHFLGDLAVVHVADIDGDRAPEVLVGGFYGGVMAFDTSSLMPLWRIDSGRVGQMDLGDVDGDGDVELVFGRATSAAGAALVVANAETGESEWESPDLNGPFVVPALGDVDGDGRPDLVTASLGTHQMSRSGRIVVLDPEDGSVRALSGQAVLGTNGLIHDLRAIDLDQSAGDEIIVATRDHSGAKLEAYAFDGDSFELVWNNRDALWGVRFTTVEAGDLDLDGSSEIVGGTYPEFSNSAGAIVYAYDYPSGETLWASPLLASPPAGVLDLALADVDRDRQLEVLAIPGLFDRGVEGLYLPAIGPGDLHILDSRTGSLEATVIGEFSSVTTWQSKEGPPLILLGDIHGDLRVYSATGGKVRLLYQQRLIDGRIDGITAGPRRTLWVGSGGRLSAFRPHGRELRSVWESLDYDAGAGRAMPGFGEKVTFALALETNIWTSGPYSVNGFSIPTLARPRMPNPDPGGDTGKPDCTSNRDLVVGPRRVDADETFSACGSISTRGKVVISDGVTAEFLAGELIAFGNGLEVSGNLTAAPNVSWFGWP